MTLGIHGVHKSYGPTEVLKGIDIVGERGQVVAIVGANGAGKSTLIKILSGAEAMTSGELRWDGELLDLRSPHDAGSRGIRTVYQELTLISELSVTENLLMGQLPMKRGFIDWSSAHVRAQSILDELGFGDIDARQLAGDLTVARQQMVEIAKAVATEPSVLILDEPSAVLAGGDLESLFALIRRLQARGVIVIYVSHRLDEVTHLADTIVVIRDGVVVETTTPAETSEDALITAMAGRRLERIYPERRDGHAEAILEVDALSRDGEFDDVSFTLHGGEVVGMFGLVGAGRSELAQCLFGGTAADRGAVSIGGEQVEIDRPRTAIRRGVALVTEDRKRSGLVAEMTVRDNITLASLSDDTVAGMISRKRRDVRVDGMVARFDIRPKHSADMPIGRLSGGNQQKAILAKWLLLEPRVLILDEPTRGVDMATRVEIYRVIDSLARSGHTILLISSDLTEAIGATDRLLVMHEGRIAGQLTSANTTEDEVLALAIGKTL
ncbi:sugar ABC transporter ATP-binding protein [Agromyces larvae]|uniref:Sugar ABC transporter ATP-binding protein n=1 Tax=Agromyces larvae TaxID=2929802 RepID=A0ABY4C1K0_9MICO|nr:sugar ABC transporter ATP-binding protein [Agromyces larvae]UOE45069.1 sugar ABC transporter ATP-binding protein [Agromyces larvae]